MPILSGLDGFFNGRRPFNPQGAVAGTLMGAARGGAGATSTLDDAFDASGCNSHWYTATTPSSQYFADLGTAGKTVICWESFTPSLREFRIKAYDHGTQTWSQTYFIGTYTLFADDHGVPAIYRDNNGFFHAMGGSHGTPNMSHYKSNSANDISAWTAQTDLGTPYTYPHPNLVGSSVYLFRRKDVSGGTQKYTYALQVGTHDASGVVTWGSEIIVGDFEADSRWYSGNHVIRGTDIYMCATRANAADAYRKDVFILIYNTLDGSVRNLTGNTTVAAGSFPLTRTGTLETNFRHYVTLGDTGNIPQICFDLAGNLHLAFSDGSLGSAFSIYHMMWNGSAWTTKYQVAQTDPNNDLHRYDGFTVAPRDDGGIDFYTVTASGFSNTRGGNMALASRSAAGVWTGPTTIKAMASGTALCLDEPVMVRDGIGELNACFNEVSFIQTLGVSGTESYLARAYATGKNGFIKTPYGPDVQSYVARLASTPTAAVQRALMDFVDQLRGDSSGDCWKFTTAIYLACLANDTDFFVNLKQSRFTLTKTGSPVWENPGWRNVSGGNFAPGIAMNSKYASTNFSASALFKPNGNANSFLGTSSANDLVTEWNGTTAKGRIGGSEAALSAAFSASIGVLGASRTGTTVKIIGDGAVLASGTATNVAFSSNSMTIGQRNSTQSLHTYYAVEFGFYKSDAAMATMAAAMKTLVNALYPGTVP